MKRIQISILLLSVFNAVSAVNINHGDLGEAVVLPYFTVNNGLNTIMTINNSTTMTKAVKVHFREGKEGKSVLSFNLFLGPNDMWAAGLASSSSSFPDHQGESSASLFFVDSSCAPYLNSGQEFLPYEIDAESTDTNMARTTEGYIEVIEMGNLDPSSGLGLAANGGYFGSFDCAEIQAAYDGGIWNEDNGDLTEQLLPVTGGLSASLGLIDVAEGTMYSLETVAFESFYPAEEGVFHTTIGDTRIPSLADADTSSLVITEGEPVITEWQQGYQAINALLMKYQAEILYDLEPAIAAKTEVIFSMPTKRF